MYIFPKNSNKKNHHFGYSAAFFGATKTASSFFWRVESAHRAHCNPWTQELMEEFREDWEPAVEALNEAEARLVDGCGSRVR